jgi:hypothetical protein
MGEPIYNPEEVSEKFYKKPESPQNYQEPSGIPREAQAEQPSNIGNSNDEVFNLQDASDELPEIQPVPEGMYECEVENAEKTYSKNGKVMLALRFRILEPVEYQNRSILWNIVPTTTFGVTRLKQFISRTGLTKQVNMAKFDLQEFADSGIAIGKTCRLSLKIQSYKRKDGTMGRSNSVRDIFPSGGTDYLVNK